MNEAKFPTTADGARIDELGPYVYVRGTEDEIKSVYNWQIRYSFGRQPTVASSSNERVMWSLSAVWAKESAAYRALMQEAMDKTRRCQEKANALEADGK